MAKAAQKPALDNAHRRLDLRLVARPARSGRQHRTAVMGRHPGIGAVNLRIVTAGLDHRDLRIIRNQQRRCAAEGLERVDVAAEPVRQGLAPARLRIGQARRAQHRHEQMRLTRLSLEAVDHHRHRVAGVIDKQLLAGGMVLAHRHRQIGRPAPVEIAEAAIAIAVRVTLDIFVPQDLKRHMLALQLTMDMGPVRLDAATMARFCPVRPVKRSLQNRIGDLIAKRPGKPGCLRTTKRFAHRRRRSPDPVRNRLVAKALFKSVAQYLADTPHGQSLRWHLVPSSDKPKEGSCHQQSTRHKQRREGGGIISESGGGQFSERGGEIISESGGDIPRNLQSLPMRFPWQRSSSRVLCLYKAIGIPLPFTPSSMKIIV